MASLIALGEKFLHTIGRICRVIMAKLTRRPLDSDEPKLGRKTVDDDRLSTNRDAILGILCAWWPHIGWELTTAGTREELRRALAPVKDHGSRQHIDRLLRPTSLPTKPMRTRATEIRQKREALGGSVKRMYEAQAKHTQCANACVELERAITQATPEQLKVIETELSKEKGERQIAQKELETANATLKIAEEQLLDEEAAFAQDEVLAFIKGKYANRAVNLANAMAGLPFAVDVPFLGAAQSYARASQLNSSTLPSFHLLVFEAIESIWQRSQRSSLPLLEFFQQEIKALPKTIPITHPTLGLSRVDNYARTHLCENWWYLQRAIEKSQQSNDDPRPMHFRIAANFDKLLAEPRTSADSAVAKAASIRN